MNMNTIIEHHFNSETMGMYRVCFHCIGVRLNVIFFFYLNKKKVK